MIAHGPAGTGCARWSSEAQAAYENSASQLWNVTNAGYGASFTSATDNVRSLCLGPISVPLSAGRAAAAATGNATKNNRPSSAGSLASTVYKINGTQLAIQVYVAQQTLAAAQAIKQKARTDLSSGTFAQEVAKFTGGKFLPAVLLGSAADNACIVGVEACATSSYTANAIGDPHIKVSACGGGSSANMYLRAHAKAHQSLRLQQQCTCTCHSAFGDCLSQCSPSSHVAQGFNGKKWNYMKSGWANLLTAPGLLLRTKTIASTRTGATVINRIVINSGTAKLVAVVSAKGLGVSLGGKVLTPNSQGQMGAITAVLAKTGKTLEAFAYTKVTGLANIKVQQACSLRWWDVYPEGHLAQLCVAPCQPHTHALTYKTLA